MTTNTTLNSTKAHTGHRGAGGIQQHSCGEIVPWTIVMVGCGFAAQHVYALNGITGEKLTIWHYSSHTVRLGHHDRSFAAAHRLATRDAADRLTADSEAAVLQFA